VTLKRVVWLVSPEKRCLFRRSSFVNTRVPDYPYACTLGTVHGSACKIPMSTHTGSRLATALIHHTPELSVPSLTCRLGTRTTDGVLNEPNLGGSSGGGPVVDESLKVRALAKRVALPLQR
jgi:hypothetical protein